MSLPPDDGCPRTAESGAYLLGALDTAERADYVAHLPNCPDCLREVGQLAALPGLLAHSPSLREGEEAPSAGPKVPETLPGPAPDSPTLTAALTEARRRRTRQRVLLLAGFALAAVLSIGATSALAPGLSRPVTGVSAAARLPVPMHPMGAAQASAAVELTDRPWGTEVVMRCRYQGSTEYRAPTYVLVAKAADGTSTELARWSAVPGQDVVLATATDLVRPKLAELEVHDSVGAVVLSTDHV